METPHPSTMGRHKDVISYEPETGSSPNSAWAFSLDVPASRTVKTNCCCLKASHFVVVFNSSLERWQCPLTLLWPLSLLSYALFLHAFHPTKHYCCCFRQSVFIMLYPVFTFSPFTFLLCHHVSISYYLPPPAYRTSFSVSSKSLATAKTFCLPSLCYKSCLLTCEFFF